MYRSTIRSPQNSDLGPPFRHLYTSPHFSEQTFCAVRTFSGSAPDHEQTSAIVKGEDSAVGTRAFICTLPLDGSWVVI
jgi:hypothetical protein